MLARNQLHVETVIVASVHDALQILDERVPDLILTSAVLLPRDEAALTERLRQLAAAGLKPSLHELWTKFRRALGQTANILRPVAHGSEALPFYGLASGASGYSQQSVKGRIAVVHARNPSTGAPEGAPVFSMLLPVFTMLYR